MGTNGQEASSAGIVYVLRNPAFPQYVKIGRTTSDVDRRLWALYSTGVPLPFECVYAGRVRPDLSEADVEKRLHTAFAPHRINPGREFFEMESDRAKAILELLTEDITDTVAATLDSSIDDEEKEVRDNRSLLNEDERRQRDAKIVALHRRGGLSQQVIADEVGTSRSTVFNTIARWREAESTRPVGDPSERRSGPDGPIPG